MITELSKKVSLYLVENGADPSEEEVLAYGAECTITMALSIGLLLFVGLLTGHVIELFVWSLSYSLLRINLGGLHASTHFWCIIIGTGIGASSILLSPLWLREPILSAVLMVLAAVSSVLIAPVPHKHKQHIQKQRLAIKGKVAITVVAECLLVVLLYFQAPMFAGYIVSGVVMATALAFAGLLLNPR